MPYIREQARSYFDKLLELLKHSAIADPGELNFLISQLIVQYMVNHPKKYQTINDVIGALECAKVEFYRRVAAGYENGKITENGDVFPNEVLK